MTLNDRLLPDMMSESKRPAFADPTAWLGEAKVTLDLRRKLFHSGSRPLWGGCLICCVSC